ncbi:MAG TPA: SDR family oxidoreductase [Thermomicrobiales bacterium]|nr:SDR family oxidoreductase [Thermomicrobiales bacterium]
MVGAASDLSLNGKIAIVTGASRRQGIGAAVCRAFASHGADVVFTHWQPYDRVQHYGPDEDGPAALERELRDLGVRAHAVACDLSDPDAPFRLLDQAQELIGSPSILVNNAVHSERNSFRDLDAKALDTAYAVNVRAMALLSVEFARRYPGGPGGRIINMSSGQGVGPMPGELAYVTTKGAIEAFTSTLAAEVAMKGITVNAIDPGATDTGWMTEEFKAAIARELGFGRVGLPEDAARLILFLASDAGAWITGQTIHSRGA